MLPGFLLSLREGLEAALVIGIVLGAIRKIGRDDLKAVVWQGALAAGAVSILAAAILNILGAEFEGTAEMVFEGTTLIVAVALLTWMIFWMRQQSRSLKKEIESSVSRAVKQIGGKALFAVAFLAVVREGLELSLFLAAARYVSGSVQTIAGAALGLAAAAMLGWALFATTRRLNLARFFQVTNILLVLFSAGMVAQGIHEFNEAGIIPGLVDQVWNLGPILSDQSIPGAILKTLLGYTAAPSLTQLVAYLAYLGILIWLLAGSPRPNLRKAQA